MAERLNSKSLGTPALAHAAGYFCGFAALRFPAENLVLADLDDATTFRPLPNSPSPRHEAPFQFASLRFEQDVWMRRSFSLVLLFAIAVTSALPGCVHRRMTVTSNPPGARVLLDGDEVGETPTSVDFTHYGTREVVLQKDGYDTLKTMQTVSAPWYQILPFEFFADNLLPFQMTNRHEFTYQLQPSSTIVPTQELLGRANALRSEAHAGP